MDVIPVSKPDVKISMQKSDMGPHRTGGPKSLAAVAPMASDTAQITDPVKRAEQAIGPFFEDESFPAGRFSIDQDSDSGRYVYRLIDIETKEVLKQFPGDYVLRRVAYYRELQGLAVDSAV
ncbi:MAG: hypothetical protein COB93_06525 [Sneathiella sp.]|nr:MAG: hypothetical protein COB93_06525 [Sneathiella sp.]